MNSRTVEDRESSRTAGAGIACVSAGVTAWQLALMQWLGWVQWYHFAYLVIAIALLGFGAAGTALTLARERWLPKWRRLSALTAALAAATMALALPVAGSRALAPDLYLLFTDSSQLARLAGASFALAIPFFFSGLAVGLVLTARAARAGGFYAWNLAGSGAGGVAGWLLLGALAPSQIPALVSVLPLAGAVLLARGSDAHGLARFAPAAVATAVIMAANLLPFESRPSQFKDLSRMLDLPGAQVVVDVPDPRGRLQIVDAPVFRPAPPTSLRFAGDYPVQRAILLDGNLRGSLMSASDDTGADAARAVFDHALETVAWAMAPRDRVLFIESGGDGFATWATGRGASRVVCAEPHPGIARELARVLREGAVVVNASARDVLGRGGEPFDAIRFPMAGAFGGTVGMGAVGEQFLFTAEAFAAALARLADDGVILASAWTEQPERNAPRLLATLLAGLRIAGAEEPRAHVAAIQSWSAMTFLVKRTPFTEVDAIAIEAFASRLEFDVLILRGEATTGEDRFHEASGSALADQVSAILAGDLGAAEAATSGLFRLGAATDDRPYFSQFLRISKLAGLARERGWHSVPFVEMGYLVVALSAPVLAVAALVLILAPLPGVARTGRLRTRTAVFCTCLGLGFMFVEIGLIARMTLFLGSALTSAATVITTLLVVAGIGSALSQRFQPAPHVLARIAMIAALTIVGTGALAGAVAGGWHPPAAVRVAVASVLMAPGALVMGMAFPTLLRLLEVREPSHVPWAWAVNGCASVVAPSLAMILAVNAGHGTVFAAAGVAYAIAAVAFIGIRQQQ